MKNSELRSALNVVKDALGERYLDRRTKEHKAVKIIENSLFPPDALTEEEIDRIINEVMSNSQSKYC